MICENINELKEKLKLENTKSVCIIDNNLMNFIVELKKQIDISYIFSNYDLILIPKWVEVEINDSQIRKSCLQEIAQYKDVYVVDELFYSELFDDKDYALAILFVASTSRMAKEKGRLVQFIKKQEDEVNPNDFIDNLYNNILIDDKESLTKSGRRKKKNAGEISICVLSHLIRYNYDYIRNITVFTFDSDCYDFIQESRDLLYNNKKVISENDNIFKGKRKISITFKSNDFILKEMFDLGKDNNMTIIDNVRKNDRHIKYTHKKTDGSIEEIKECMNTDEFKEFIKKEDIHLIF